MAVISKLEEDRLLNPKKSKETDAKYYIVDDFEERYIQIDTFGSKDRKFPNKVSQSIRINKETAKQLIEIFQRSFDL